MRFQVTQKERERMVQLHKDGLNYDTIGRRMNRSGRTVSRIIRKAQEAEKSAKQVSSG